MAKIREVKKSGNKKPPNPNKGIRKKNENTKLELPLMSQTSIAIPEFFATKNINKNGIVSYRLVNPLTKTRNLSKRNGETSIKLIRKPIDDMIIMEHTTEPIPLKLFSKKDRAIIDTHFKVIETHKDKDIADIPHSAPFKNKERGRPEKLQKNIQINKQRKGQNKENITMNLNESDSEAEEEEPTPQPTKKKTKPIKYATEEERKEAIKIQKRESARRIREAKKAGKGINGGKLSVNQLKGLLNASYDKSIENVDGFAQDKDLSSDTTKVYHNPQTNHTIVAHKGTQGASDWLNNGVYALGGDKAYMMTPRFKEAQKIQEEAEKKYGANTISTIGHSQGSKQAELLGKNTKEIITLNKATRPFGNTKQSNQYDIRTTGDIVSANNPFQKKNDNEILIKSKTHNPLTEHSIDVLNQLDPNQEIGRGFKKSAGKVLKHLVSHIIDIKEPVDIRDFNQAKMLINDFKNKKTEGNSDSSSSDAESSVKGKGITKSKPYIVQSVVFDKSKHTIKDAKKWLKDNGYKSPKVDEESNTIRFRQLDPTKMEKKGYTKYRNKTLGNSGISLVLSYMNKKNISNNNIMPKFEKGSQEAKEYMASIRNKKGKKGGSVGSILDSQINSTLSPVKHLFGGSVGSMVDSQIDSTFAPVKHLFGGDIAPHSRSYGSQLGFGVHHHHHYHMGGEGFFDDIGRAFNPQTNGVAKAFEPIQQKAEQTFTPQLGRDITSGLIHKALPMAVSSATGSLVGTATGNPALGFVAGQTLGKYAGQQAGDALGNATGYGFKKGSKEAKEHMAKIRAMRGKKN